MAVLRRQICWLSGCASAMSQEHNDFMQVLGTSPISRNPARVVPNLAGSCIAMDVGILPAGPAMSETPIWAREIPATYTEQYQLLWMLVRHMTMKLNFAVGTGLYGIQRLFACILLGCQTQKMHKQSPRQLVQFLNQCSSERWRRRSYSVLVGAAEAIL